MDGGCGGKQEGGEEGSHLDGQERGEEGRCSGRR